MKTQRSKKARGVIAALAVLPLALGMSACQFGVTTQSGGDKGGSNPAASESNGSASSQATGAPKPRTSQVQGTWEGGISGKSFRVDVNAVVVKDGVTTLTMTFTNAGSKDISGWYYSFGGDKMLSDDVKLTDPQNNLVYTPGKGPDKSCMCSKLESTSMSPGESRTVFTTFKGLPDGVNAVTVSVPNVAPFEGIPVTRE